MAIILAPTSCRAGSSLGAPGGREDPAMASASLEDAVNFAQRRDQGIRAFGRAGTGPAGVLRACQPLFDAEQTNPLRQGRE